MRRFLRRREERATCVEWDGEDEAEVLAGLRHGDVVSVEGRPAFYVDQSTATEPRLAAMALRDGADVPLAISKRLEDPVAFYSERRDAFAIELDGAAHDSAAVGAARWTRTHGVHVDHARRCRTEFPWHARHGRRVLLTNFPDENDALGTILSRRARYVGGSRDRKTVTLALDGTELVFTKRGVEIGHGPYAGQLLWAADNPLFTLDRGFQAPPRWMIDLPLSPEELSFEEDDRGSSLLLPETAGNSSSSPQQEEEEDEPQPVVPPPLRPPRATPPQTKATKRPSLLRKNSARGGEPTTATRSKTQGVVA